MRVLEKIDAYYLPPTERSEKSFTIKPNMARGLILGETDFVTESLELLNSLTVLTQYVLGWLGDLDAEDLKRELTTEFNSWIDKVERETQGLADTSSMRNQLMEPLRSLNLNQLKNQSLEQQPKTGGEWNQRFSRIDNTAPEEVANLIFSELGNTAARQLRGMFPKKNWPNGAYEHNGALTGLAFFLFTQGVGRDRTVKRGSQSNRRKRLRAQFRDCRHIAEAARCDMLLSIDGRAITLAKAVYAHAGVNTFSGQVVLCPKK